MSMIALFVDIVLSLADSVITTASQTDSGHVIYFSPKYIMTVVVICLMARNVIALVIVNM